MTSPSERVANRFLVAEAIGDPKDFLRDFEIGIRQTTQPADKLAWAKEELGKAVASGNTGFGANTPPLNEARDIALNALFVIKRPDRVNRVFEPGHQLFLSILQKLTLPPALRKKVEMASRTYLKNPNPRFKNRSGPKLYLEYIALYEKYMALFLAHLAVAKEALAKGKEHSEEGEGATKIKVGPFTLVNTGGFSTEQMNEVVEVMKKATSYAQSAGFGSVCYGEVQVTNTIHKRDILAFYLLAKDELFVRANVNSQFDSVQTILHELGHRYQHKVLKNDAKLKTLYRVLEGQERRRSWGLDSQGQKVKPKEPNPGEKLVTKGKTYIVTRTSPSMNGYKVHLMLEGEPKVTATISLDGFWANKGEKARNFDEDPNYIGFVTDYAKRGGPGENFAEMFSYYCLGRLPTLQSVEFEETVWGTQKTASQRVAHRFSAESK